MNVIRYVIACPECRERMARVASDQWECAACGQVVRVVETGGGTLVLEWISWGLT